MKTIMLIIALLGFTTVSDYAQSASCGKCCKKKVVHHKTTRVATVKHKAKRQTGLAQTGRSLIVLPPSQGCYIDSVGNYQVMTSNTFGGYYPRTDAEASCNFSAGLEPRFSDLVVSSSAFANNGPLPAKYTCEGSQMSPPLNVKNIPDGTQSLAVIMVDPKATPTRSNTYWMVWNVDPSGRIPENLTTDYTAQNPYSKLYGYTAICPVGGEHSYHFMVYALDTKLTLGKNTTRAKLEDAMRGRVLAKGEITGVYKRGLD
jgi:Raf kinase inhibitor-like YbhB/YbcL family protein